MNPEIKTQCSYCKKWEWPEGWKEEKPSGVIDGIKGNISHGICPKCFKETMDKI